MTSIRHGLELAAREHLASGQPITRLEAIVLYGVSDLPSLVRRMRREGWVIQSRLVPYTVAATRINRHAVLKPPANLPTREVQFIDYWASK